MIAHETYSLVKDDISVMEQMPISDKGFARPVRCYKVEGSYEAVAKPGTVVQYSADAGTIALKLDRLNGEERQQLRKTLTPCYQCSTSKFDGPTAPAV